MNMDEPDFILFNNSLAFIKYHVLTLNKSTFKEIGVFSKHGPFDLKLGHSCVIAVEMHISSFS